MEEEIEDYRTYADTQIYIEDRWPTLDEWLIISGHGPIRYLDDYANGYIAISFNNYNQQKDETFGEAIVDKLNDLAYQKGEEGLWWLGYKYEEYVFCF